MHISSHNSKKSNTCVVYGDCMPQKQNKAIHNMENNPTISRNVIVLCSHNKDTHHCTHNDHYVLIKLIHAFKKNCVNKTMKTCATYLLCNTLANMGMRG